jgi:hypothetical protein
LNVSEDSQYYTISALPNPFSTEVIVSSPDGSDFDVTLYDVQGREIKGSVVSKNGNAGFKNLDVLMTGIYFARIETAQGQQLSIQLIKE